MKTLDLNALPAEAWRPAATVNGRAAGRVAERELERLPCRIIPRQGGEIRVALRDCSLHGFAVLQNLDGRDAPRLCVGDRVRLRLELEGAALEAECAVANLALLKGKTRIGLSRRDLDRRPGPESRTAGPHGELLRIPAEADIFAEAGNPVFFGESSRLRLCGLRSGLRFDLLAEDPALPLFRGQRLDLQLRIPCTGGCGLRGHIEALELAPGGRIKARLRVESMDPGLANDLAEFLVHEQDVSPETLRRLGFPTRVFRHRIGFRFVETMDDYAQVLALRRNAYVEAGKRSAGTAPEEMSLAWDKRSRILCGFFKDTLVASAALTFPASDDEVMRSETAFPGGRFPGNPPPRTAVMEVNSLCTHKDFRRGDLLHAVFEQIARVFVLSDRKHIMNLSDDDLLPMYLGVGFKDQGHVGLFLGRPHHLIKADKETVTRGKGLGWLRWNLLYGDLMRELRDKRMVALTTREAWALRLRLALGPLARRMRAAGLEKRFRAAAAGMDGTRGEEG